MQPHCVGRTMASASLPPLSTPQFSVQASPTTSADFHTPLSLVRYCSSLRELKQIHAVAIKTNLQDDLPTITRLVSSCTIKPSEASVAYAHKLFDQNPEPTIVLFNILSRGYSRLDGDLSIKAVYLFSRVLSVGLAPDFYTFPSLLKACAASMALEEGRQLHGLALKLGIVGSNIFVSPSLINLYTECNDVDGARKVFDGIPSPCVVTYNSMITGYVRASRPNEALSMFREMQARDLLPNDVTMLSVLSSCAQLGALDLGKWVHEYVKKNGFNRFVKVNTALIDMYAKCGSLEDAVSVFREMEVRDTQAWSAIIVAHGIHGRSFKAISIYEEMKRAGMLPDQITFLGLLHACSQTGLVEEGYKFFNSMRNEFGISPNIKHYGCMVDLLGRAGQLEEAYKFIDDLPIKPTPILWRTLLSACSSHDNLEMGKQVIDQIFELDSSHGGDYVIFSNMCAQSGKWDEVDRMRKLMGDRGATKVPGCSSIELDNVVHEFFSGDGVGSSISTALHRSTDKLFEELKLVGYVPDTSLVNHVDMEEDEKEMTLRYHSEKLAISYGLLNSSPRMTIRVVKNLRVCRDCHSAAKLISSVFSRRIILRDVQRFHHFEDGECSCGDFW
ncbi:hypothetical protein SAY86_020700 [Trapa natans]|uniref:DYW domain-containing protein n=1 Tax=Trapa natans TaxID=22666 RepID=A0AAN7M430_TRANT|nr:hypothetical protein SAY86_020700 [Trapa natans]